MSVKISIATIEVDNIVELEQTVENLEENLKFYSYKHPDFSCVIEQHTNLNQIIIKSIHLAEHAN